MVSPPTHMKFCEILTFFILSFRYVKCKISLSDYLHKRRNHVKYKETIRRGTESLKGKPVCRDIQA